MNLLLRFGFRAEDTRKLSIMAPIFFFGGVAELLSFTAFMALFNQRFGVQYIPVIYLFEALIIPAEGWLLSFVTQKLSKPKLMRSLYVIMIAILLINGAFLLTIKFSGISVYYYYPVLFISSNFVVRQLTLLLWSTAFDLCPTQQAKKLMPVFIAAATLGSIVAGVIAQQVGRLWGTEYVYLLGSMMLLAGFWSFRKAIARYLVPMFLKDVGLASTGITITGKAAAGQQSTSFFKQIMKSPFLLSAIGLMTLMPALYFIMEYQYLTSAHHVYPAERDLTAFYGLMVVIQFSASLLLQTVSGRLMNWFGASNILLGISIIFLGGFAMSAILINTPYGLISVSIGFATLYLLLYYFAEPCYQLFFKMLPMGQRDSIRYTAQGIAASAGIMIGALLSLLHTVGWVGMAPLSIIGIFVAMVLVMVAWFGKVLYVKQLVDSVQSMHMNISDIAVSFLGGMKNSKALSGVAAFLNYPNDYVREVALEIIGMSRDSAYLQQLIALISDDSPRIRIAALRAMDLESADIMQLVQVASFLEDEDVQVRIECVRQLAKAAHLKSQAHFFIRNKLLDSNPLVVAESVRALYSIKSSESYSACDEQLTKLIMTGGAASVAACGVIGDIRLTQYIPQILELVNDTRPAVKVSAIHCLGKLGYIEIVTKLLALYPLADQEMRKTIVQAIIEMGDACIPDLLEAAWNPHPFIWNAAVRSLAGLMTESKVKESLVEVCSIRLLGINEEKVLPAVISQLGLADLADLASRRCNEISMALYDAVWSVLARLADEQVVTTVRQAIDNPDSEIRENGLEVLAEGLGDRRLSSVMLTMYKSIGKTGENEFDKPLEILDKAAGWSDEWLKEIAVSARARWEHGPMQEERKFLSMLDKVIFLKQIPLFSNLSIDELGLIAGIANEEIHSDQAYLLRRDEVNPTMYLIVEGNIELSGVSAGGWEGTIGVLGPKEVFGDTTVLNMVPSAITAQALFDDVRLLALQGENLLRLVRLYPEIGIGLLSASSARVRLLENMLMKMG